MAKKKIYNYKFYPGIGIDESPFHVTCSIKSPQNIRPKEVTAWIARQVQLNATGFVGYTYNAQVRKRHRI